MEDNVSLGGERDPLLPRERQQIEQIDFRSGRETLQRSKCDAGCFVLLVYGDINCGITSLGF